MSKTMIKVSIIVPVYNAEKYLSRSIDSILRQTLSDFELILVDDGSIDKSGEICEEYARKDSRIKVIHKTNGGVASARQAGISVAHCVYSIHIDPDDWVEPSMLEELYNTAIINNADVVTCDFYYEKGNKTVYCKQKPHSTGSNDMLRSILSDQLHGSVWNKLIRTELYEKLGISFPENMTYMEDTFVVCSLFMHPLRIEYVPKAYYHYDVVINQNSLSRQSEKSLSIKGINSLAYFIDYFKDKLPQEEYHKALIYRMKLYKLYLWNSKLCTKSLFYEKYKGFNDEISEALGEKLTRSLSLALSGHYYIGRCLYHIRKLKERLSINK